METRDGCTRGGRPAPRRPPSTVPPPRPGRRQYRRCNTRERARLVREALDSVGLGEHLLSRRPTALSGGQRQRVAIARALVVGPDVIVLDEPTSALDVSVQADIVEVLLGLQAELGLTFVFVSHDLSLVRQLAHTVSVMQSGRIVEHGTVARILDSIPVGRVA